MARPRGPWSSARPNPIQDRASPSSDGSSLVLHGGSCSSATTVLPRSPVSSMGSGSASSVLDLLGLLADPRPAASMRPPPPRLGRTLAPRRIPRGLLAGASSVSAAGAKVSPTPPSASASARRRGPEAGAAPESTASSPGLRRRGLQPSEVAARRSGEAPPRRGGVPSAGSASTASGSSAPRTAPAGVRRRRSGRWPGPVSARAAYARRSCSTASSARSWEASCWARSSRISGRRSRRTRVIQRFPAARRTRGSSGGRLEALLVRRGRSA
jgi:hypothetical protein